VLVIRNAAGLDAVVVDMLGCKIWSGKVDKERFAVDVRTWARGTYLLHVHNAWKARVVKFVLAE